MQNAVIARESIDLDPPSPTLGRLSISVPRSLHSAPLRIAEEEKVRAMAGSLGSVGRDDSSAALVKLALLLGGSRRDDWIVHDDRLHSFTPLGACDDFRRVTSDDVLEHHLGDRAADPESAGLEPVMARLLHRTLRGSLEARSVAWHAARRVFRFMPLAAGDRERRECWEERGSREQSVYLGKGRHGGTLDVALHTHLAFAATFERTDGLWHCDVGAGWLYTDDLFQENDAEVSSRETRRRHDAAVGAREALQFLAYFLADDPSPPDTSVKFGDLDPDRSLPATPIGNV